ncbi:fibronectin type III domain-containing protein [Listeria booriae]|uniref:Fibronectin type III domain-containing protein n=1 Tax=Listeria booriae TaxID=1552123 RepID=A0A842F9K7_9LIST|nr:fibronectin type III domain-containing protein [Listeria booriae]
MALLSLSPSPERPSNLRVLSFTDESITFTWDDNSTADEYLLYLGGEEQPRRFNKNIAVVSGLIPKTFYSASVSGKNGFLEGELSNIKTQKTRMTASIIDSYIAFVTYMSGKTENNAAVTNARLYMKSKYLATGTVTAGAVSVYMTGVMGGYYARKIALSVNGTELPAVAVLLDGSFRYYAKDKITKSTDVVKLIIYNQGNAVMDTFDVVISNTNSKQESELGNTVNSYKLNDSYVTGTYNTDFILNALDGKSAAPDTIESMPVVIPILLPKIEVYAVSSVAGVVAGVTENNGQVKVTVDGVAKTILTADSTGVYSGNISGIISGSIVLVEAKVGSYYPSFKSITVPAPDLAPKTPTGVAISAVTKTTATLSWPATAGATSYKLYQNGYTTLWKTTTATSYALTGTSGSTWTYQVVAVNANGDSLRSEAVSVTYQ